MLQTIIKKNNYQDSVVLMLLTSKLNQLSEVERVSIMMGTPANKDIFIASGFDTEELQTASSNDMVIMLDVNDQNQTDKILSMIDEELNQQNENETKIDEKINSWEKAVKKLPDANIALISVPGEYAALEIEHALDNGLHAFVFSDNVDIADEKRLKQKAHDLGLLVMGPDCGTGVIHGLPLAFTNKIRKGNIGVVGASGTGIQEVTTLIHRYGGGVTNAIGTGGRDLSTEVGAISMIDSILALNEDPDTEIIVVLSKPPANEIKQKVLSLLRKLDKPVVTLFLGEKPKEHEQNLYHAYTLEETAQLAYKITQNEPVSYTPREITSELKQLSNKGIRAFYSGGTLAYEAAFLLKDALSLPNNPAPEGYILKTESYEVLDLGDDLYTKGKPHPMIDPEIRIDRIRKVVGEPDVSVVLFDVVLGYGAHPDMASALIPAIKEVQEKVAADGRELSFVAVVVGTDQDPQNMTEQIRLLQDCGIIVCENNVQAVQTALNIIGETLDFPEKNIIPKKETDATPLPQASSLIKELISTAPRVINVGLPSFAQTIQENHEKVTQFDWRPSAGGDVHLQKVLYFLNQYQFENPTQEGKK